MHRKTPTKKFPSVITIFSAPNYLDVYNNRGAVLKYANKNITIRQFNYSSHPYWLPNFVDAFTWSLPFVGAKITDMLLAVLSVCSQEELAEHDSDEEHHPVDAGTSPADIAKRRQEIKAKILAIGKMQRVFQMLREESENATELQVGDGAGLATPRTSTDALGVQGAKIGRQIRSFEDARRVDMLNERLPEFNVAPAPTMYPGVPSLSMRRGSADSDGLTMEYLIKKTLEEDEDDGGYVERIADKIAQGRTTTTRPSALKRHGTA
ncbi:hypothetical protein DXG03_006541 [Asterophora parasitica]|uniref:Uncharacterized protein n=1 Tax=Asterophora parasitica TaxID=117018 RepID=A0A9P7FYL6_9AGAR|nr:hypothetical protein DXG03_006541 [Asterophora parasitica]